MLFTDYLMKKSYYAEVKESVQECAGSEFIPVNPWKSFRYGENYAVYAPLVGRIFFLNKQEFDDFRAGNAREEFKQELLFIPKELDLSPSLDPDFFTARDKKILYITPSLECNMSCRYCYSKGDQGRMRISWDFVKAALDFFPKDVSLKVGFAPGGEPTLAMSIIKKTVNYARQRFKKAIFSCGTNGTLPLNDLKWLINNDVTLHISFDGLPEIQDFHRPLKNTKSSHKLVENTIKELVKNHVDFTVKPVVSSANISLLDRNVWYLYKLGIKTIVPLKMRETLASKHNKLKTPSVAHFFNEIFRLDEFSALVPGLRVTYHRGISNGLFSQACSARMNLTPDNTITSCIRIIKRKKSPFVCGFFDNKNKKLVFDNDKINRLVNRSIYSVPECGSCWARFSCGGGCPEEVYNEKKSIDGIALGGCNIAKLFYAKQIDYLVKTRIIRNRPCLYFKKDEILMKLNYQELKLRRNMLSKDYDGVLLVINEDNLETIRDKVLRFKSEKPFLFLFNYSFKHPSIELGEKIKAFFVQLKAKHCWFLLTKPLPKCLFEDYDAVVKGFGLPKSCNDCLSLYYKENDELKLCKYLSLKEKNIAGISKISEAKVLKAFEEGNLPRDELLGLVKKNALEPGCGKNSCAYLIREHCCNSL